MTAATSASPLKSSVVHPLHDLGPLRALCWLKASLKRLPRAAQVCALIACLNAVCWSLITPPFQTPDEPAHFAYVKQLAETRHLPTLGTKAYSEEEFRVLEALLQKEVRLRPQIHPIETPGEQHRLNRVLKSVASLRRNGSPAVGVAISEPPLYYALEAIPYVLADSGSLLDRLQLMRLMSAIFAGFTAMFVFLFVREAIPSARHYWTVGALAVALSPLLGLMSGSVNPDSMLYAVVAAIFYLFARSFRYGYTTRRAIMLGTVCALGFLTKLTFIGLAPGAFLGLILLAVRTASTSRRAAVQRMTLSAGIALSPGVLYAAVNTISGHSTLGIVSSAINNEYGSPWAKASYIWQLFLPRLPGMQNDFPGLFTTRQLWFNGFVGRYGWLDTVFPEWANMLALLPAVIIALLIARSIVTSRSTIRARSAELIVYTAMSVGLVVLIGAYSYRAFPRRDAEFAQVRYLLPLLPLFASALILATRGLGRRWGPIAGTLIVILFFAQDVFSQMQVIARFYG